jgi:tripartite-type tricarboxylate transporter receptor subunit TctC
MTPERGREIGVERALSLDENQAAAAVAMRPNSASAVSAPKTPPQELTPTTEGSQPDTYARLGSSLQELLVTHHPARTANADER